MASGSSCQQNFRTVFGRQPARVLLIDLTKPFGYDVCANLCETLSNLFAVACNIGGPSRIPFCSLFVLGNFLEALLPLIHVKGNFARIQTAIEDLQRIHGELSSAERGTADVAESLQEACSQYRRNAQMIMQTSGFCCQVEVVIVSSQKSSLVMQRLEQVIASLNMESLKRVQLVNISGLDEACAMDQCDTSSSQSSFGDASDKASNCTLGSVVETVVLDADLLSLHNFFHTWLLDTGTDSEHLHLYLPTPDHGSVPTPLKCDLVERLLNPSQFYCNSQFSIHPEAGSTKPGYGTINKASGLIVPVHKLTVQSMMPASTLCESLVFGMPMIVQATSCWKVDWDELEQNQQNFRALCHLLYNKDMVLVAQMEAQLTSRKAVQVNPLSIPRGYFALLPASNLTLLIKSLAVNELLLPNNAGYQIDKPTDESLQMIESALDKVEVLDVYNPLLMSSGLFGCLRHQTKANTGVRQIKRKPPAKENQKMERNGKERCVQGIQTIGQQNQSNSKVRFFYSNKQNTELSRGYKEKSQFTFPTTL